ncbi:IS3 family transposase [Gottfriedia acidiceleris]|uniref:IS3 family transposase n=1 Tax=Gottfriedia acidiceleris TaxID=371036 RepID=A0ABY4JMH7_9BACI|nr:IS3 family transposase [Gottfriedia acidiceleris]UPM55051.1 IS3 family transposase [Gottfriedia acidiceleris]
MAKFTLDQKITVVNEYLEGKGSLRSIGKKYGIYHKHIHKWVALFNTHGLEGLNSRYTNYSGEFKMNVLTYMNETGSSVLETAAAFNIPAPSTIFKWQSILEEKGVDALYSKKRGRPIMKRETKKKQVVEGSQEALLAEIERLKMENAYFKKVECLSSRGEKITERQKAKVIYELRHEYKVIDLVKIAEIPRSTYYYWVNKIKTPDKYVEVKESIKQIFHEHLGRYGYRRITLELRNQGLLINHKTVRRLMLELGLKSLVRVKKYRSYRGNVGRIAPNLLNREFNASKPNEKWATDVTEFHLFGEKIYFSPILDLYNGEIVAYNFEKRPVFPLVTKMLDKAFKRLNDGDSPILHSDQGWHYQMKKYQHLLKENKIIQSMSRKGNCLDNAVMENFFGLLKSELFYLQEFKSIEDFILELENYIHYYNHKRIKTKLKGLSPVQYRVQSSLVA